MENNTPRPDSFNITELEYREAALKFQQRLASAPLDVFVEWLKLNSMSPEDRENKLKDLAKDSITRQASRLDTFHPNTIRLTKLMRATLIRRLIQAVHGRGWESATGLASRLITKYKASQPEESASLEEQIWWSGHVLARLVIAGQDPERDEERILAPKVADHILVLLDQLNNSTAHKNITTSQINSSNAET